MFCISLRKRKEWASVPSTLLSQQQPKWQEQFLETHDLAVPLPQRRQQDPKDFLRLLLLSATDILPPQNSLPRIERLYQAGGKHVGVVFLLHEQDSQGSGSREFMTLQATLHTSGIEMPIIPLSSASSLSETISAFRRQLSQSHAPIPLGHPATVLLPYCSNNSPIAEHARNLLSDLCHSIQELSQLATTVAGKRELTKWLTEGSPTVADKIIGFWEQEYIAD
ncbi:hypothetical protein D0Z07_2560 [Hyphodiscus hymeniophilus]|uniref:Uncharacterized protein n=1 Tax=Hyphodiscus hymeniophilus TaxID=353542 RepID=A0A9P7AZE6_9HELO|nr:hypothetical protein D0Z07_2560 [Hyphodiscus hymeniophilus]